MARLNVYVPDELAARTREAGLNVSALTQQAISAALAAGQTDAWLASLGRGRGRPCRQATSSRPSTTYAMTSVPSADSWVVDASVLVDLVIRGEAGKPVPRPSPDASSTRPPTSMSRSLPPWPGCTGRPSSQAAARKALTAFGEAPLPGTSCRRCPGGVEEVAGLRVADAFYVELASILGTRVLTLDARLARATTLAVLPVDVTP